MLGLARNDVHLVPWDESWKLEFEQVKNELVKEGSIHSNQIEHIGSTSIPYMSAKPLLDLMIGIDSLQMDLTEMEKRLRESGFYRLKVERPNEIIFAKFTDKTFDVKTHVIHLVKKNGTKWNDFLFFRNYLRDHSEARETYARLKEVLAETNSNNENTYANQKEAFVKEICQLRKEPLNNE